MRLAFTVLCLVEFALLSHYFVSFSLEKRIQVHHRDGKTIIRNTCLQCIFLSLAVSLLMLMVCCWDLGPECKDNIVFAYILNMPLHNSTWHSNACFCYWVFFFSSEMAALKQTNAILCEMLNMGAEETCGWHSLSCVLWKLHCFRIISFHFHLRNAFRSITDMENTNMKYMFAMHLSFSGSITFDADGLLSGPECKDNIVFAYILNMSLHNCTWHSNACFCYLFSFSLLRCQH